MMYSNMSPDEKDKLDKGFQTFMEKMMAVAKYKPKEKYLYPIMRGVPFRDLEVALDLASLERATVNDNKDE